MNDDAPTGAELAPVGLGELEICPSLPSDRDPRLVYLASLGSAKSRRAMSSALERIARECATTSAALPWHLLRYQHTQALRARLCARYAPSTTNQALAALRGVLREARRLGLVSADDEARAGDLRPAKGHRLPRGRALERAEVLALLGGCDRSTPAGARDAALVGVLYGCGLRRAELVGLDLADHDAIDGALVVRGKGDKERRVYVVAAAELLTAWLRHRGPAPGPLFLPVDRLGRVLPRRLSDQAVLFLLERLGERAGVAGFAPHDMRRTCISDLLDAGADISTVQQLAGHASVITTQRYDRRGERAKRAAAGLLHL